MSKYLDEAGLAELWRLIQVEDNKTLSNANKNVDDIKGQPHGLATLDETGKVPSAQLPGYVDDVLEYDSFSAFPTTAETGKIYVAKDTNKTYRWSGTQYTVIGGDLALGETPSTAFPGDRGSELEDRVWDLEELTESYKTQVKTKEINFEDDTFLTKTGIRTSQGFGITINYDDTDQRETITFEDGGVAHTTGNLKALTNTEIDNICK